jgi:hypothetical protein
MRPNELKSLGTRLGLIQVVGEINDTNGSVYVAYHSTSVKVPSYSGISVKQSGHVQNLKLLLHH